MEHFYTSERNAQIVISLMKVHGIRKVVVSPGTTNLCFVMSIQNDKDFELISAADERSAAYIACGIAAEYGENVAICCTGATASRNYMPGLTEAYYRKLPILAITCSRSNYQIGHNIDQVTDRRQLPKDIAKLSVQLPLIFEDEAEWGCIIEANKALLELDHHGLGPVHINLETRYSADFSIKEIPEVRAIYRIEKQNLYPQIKNKKIAIKVGAHNVWSDRLLDLVDDFCERYNAIVIHDHTSNYKGKYGVLANLILAQGFYHSVLKNVDLIIDIGDVSALKYDCSVTEVWRVNPDGELRDMYRKLKYVFECEEEEFFSRYIDMAEKKKEKSFFEECKKEQLLLKKYLPKTIERLPFSNIWIAAKTAPNMPQNAVVHFGILNSLRSWSFFELSKPIYAYSNTGGFGIDGCISSTIGASLCDNSKIYYCILGDLAFFYDINSLGNRHLKSNLRIMLINNGLGCEFKLEINPAAMFREEANTFISAEGHYGRKSRTLVKHYAEDLGFEYIKAENKEEYLHNMKIFTNPELMDKPLVFEVFTQENEDSKALSEMWSVIPEDDTSIKYVAKKALRGIVGEQGLQNIRNIIKKN